MNVSKFIATLIVKNHNNGSFTSKDDAFMRDRIYPRVSNVIELAKAGRISILCEDDRFIAIDIMDNNFKPIVIYKKNVHCDKLGDFFFGLQRTKNVTAYLSFFRHINEDQFLEIIMSDGSASVSIVHGTAKKKVRDAIYCEI